MCRYASADMERSCDDFVLLGKPYEYRKAYSETILTVIKHQKWNLLSTDFYGGVFVLKERFKNILDMKNKKSGRMICFLGCICIIVANSLLGCEMVEKMTDNQKRADVQKEILNHMEELPEELSDEELVVSYAQGFIDEFNGTIAGQKDIELAVYIKNKNLLSFAEKMIELTQKQEQLGMNAVIYGGANEFDDIVCEEIAQNLYYVNAKFCYEGSGMSCQLLIKKQNEELVIEDFYFGTPDGIDTIATGHYTEREVSNPQIWEDEDWVLGVYEKMLEYEGEYLEASFPIQSDVVEASNVTKLQIRSGSTGEEIIIEDTELINAILDSLKSLDIEKHENGNVVGYLYSINLYNNDTLIQKMLIRGDSIEAGGTIYYVGSTQDIIEYIRSLENK
jgi:hypothetical protein